MIIPLSGHNSFLISCLSSWDYLDIILLFIERYLQLHDLLKKRSDTFQIIL